MTTSTGHDEHTLRMRAALTPVLALGPDFLAGRGDADTMAKTMVRAVQEYLEGELAHREHPIGQGHVIKAAEGADNSAGFCFLSHQMSLSGSNIFLR